MGSLTKRTPDVIDMQSYDCGYAGGYAEGVDAGYEMGYVECCHDQRKAVAVLRYQQDYIRRQRIYGGAILCLTAIVTVVAMDVTWACLGIPLGLGLIFSKRRIIL